MGYYYETGKDYDQDDEKAIEWYEKAASGGCARAHWALAKIYRDGVMTESNDSHYLRHLVKAAEGGNPDAEMALANEYRTGVRLDQNDELSFRWFKKAAESGEPKAKFMIGYYYDHGIGVHISREDAERWYGSTGFLGDAELFMNIGMSFEFGLEDIAQDPTEAERWYKYGVSMGHEKCLICYNSLISAFRGEHRDTLDERLKKLDRSDTEKEITLRNASLYLADEHFNKGEEVQALKEYRKAADLGSPIAMFTLAMFYHNGIGTRRDDNKAMELLNRAASAGSPDAQFYLARLYDTGLLPKDTSEIINNYAKAAANDFLPGFYYLLKYVDHPEVYVRANRRK